MQRVLDIFQLTLYLVAIVLIILVGSSAISTLDTIRSDIKRGDIKHDQALKDHLEGLKELEQLRKQRVQ